MKVYRYSWKLLDGLLNICPKAIHSSKKSGILRSYSSAKRGKNVNGVFIFRSRFIAQNLKYVFVC
jgi:hypothetical protein